MQLVDLKLAEANYKYSLEENYDMLKKQIDTDLKPVLTKKFDFNFNEIFEFVLEIKKQR